MNADLDAEREIDLARWRRALTALWWLPVAGLVAGAIVGFAFSLGGTTSFKATSLISLGQPVSPGGVVIASFATNPRAISRSRARRPLRTRRRRQPVFSPAPCAV